MALKRGLRVLFTRPSMKLFILLPALVLLILALPYASNAKNALGGGASRQVEAKTLEVAEVQSSILLAAPKPPTIRSITPNTGGTGTTVNVSKLLGSRFQQGASVRLTKPGEPDINATNVQVLSSSRITCDLDLRDAALGTWSVVVTNPDGLSATLENSFTITTAPTISSITPNNAGSGNPRFQADINGSAFEEGLSVRLERGWRTIEGEGLTFHSPEHITCDFDLTDAVLGPWDVVVENPDGAKATLKAGFTVNRAPRVSSIAPDSAGTGNPQLSARVSGAFFRAGATVELTREGQSDITATSVSVPLGTRITCVFNLTNAQPGSWNVVVTNTDGGRDVLENGFSVTPNPTVTSITPSSAGSGDPEALISDLEGANFLSGATVKLTRGTRTINASNVDVVSLTRITCTFDLTGAPAGLWSVTVTNTDGGTGTLKNAFRVNPAPNVSSITPSSAPSGNPDVSITRLAGSRFQTGASVKLTKSGEPDITATNVVVPSSGKITCSLDLTNAEPGPWNVLVINPDGGRGTLANGFTVTPGPTVISITPNGAQTGTVSLPVDVRGTNFAPGATVKLTLSGEPDIDARDAAVVSPTELTCTLDLSSARPGSWNVLVTNTDGGSGSLGGGFTVAPPPAPVVLSISPDRSGKTVVPVTVTGENFAQGASVVIAMNGQSDITASNVIVVSSTEISCTLDLTGAQAGAWDLTVINPDSQSGTLPGGFTVIPPPVVASITPSSAGSGASLVFISDLRGENLENVVGVKLTMEGQADIDASNVDILSPSDLTCTFDLSQAVPGSPDVVVRDIYGGIGVLPGGFTVNPAPLPQTITPNVAGTGNESFSCAIGGTGFAEGATVKLTMEGADDLDASVVTVESPNSLSCVFNLSSARTGVWDLTVTNLDGGRYSLPGCFTVNPPPSLFSISPNEADQGSTLEVNLTGEDFAQGPSVRLLMSGQADITASDVMFVSSSEVSCTLGLSGAQAGSWDVVFTNTDGGTAVLPGGFTVKPVVTVASILITPDFKAVEHGSAFQFSAKGYDAEGREVPIEPEWSCDPEVGSIDQTGLFTATGWGTREVTASVGAVTGTATVSVPSVLSGTLTENMTLTKGRNPWVITSPVVIPDGITVTVEPGVVTKSYCWAQSTFIVEGKLEASGVVRDQYGNEISVDPVIMTSYRDDSLYGDTNGDGTSVGYPGDWGGPIFLNQNPGEYSTLERVELVYGGNTYYGDTPAFIIAWGSHQITNCTFRKIYSWGARITGGSSTVDGCLFENTTNGLWLEGGTTTVSNCHILTTGEPQGNGIVISAGSPTVSGNTIENMRVGIKVDTSTSMPDPVITDNTVTGCSAEAIILSNARPDSVTGNRGSSNGKNAICVGGEYAESATWNATNHGEYPSSSGLPWLITSTVTVRSGDTLTIDPGTVVKSSTWGAAGIIANGRLISGLPGSERVTVTSWRDDLIWGDTDGTPGTQGEPGDWGGLSLRGITEPSVLTRTDIKNAGSIYYPDSTAIVTVDGSHTLSECTISRSWSWGMIVSAGSPTIERTDITDTGNGIAICGGTPQVLGCTISTTGTPQGDGIVISGGSPLIKESTIGDTTVKTRIDHMRKGIRVDTSVSMPHPGIENCEITDCTEEAMDLSNCPPGQVRNNQGWGNAKNQIKVTGGYSETTSWPRNAGIDPQASGLPFYVTSPVSVLPGNTLTVEPGACAKFYTPGPPGLLIQGSLQIGTPGSERVKLTSWRDDATWGDSNGDGTSEGSPGDWGGLAIDSETQSNIHSCDMVYGGHYDPQQGIYSPFVDLRRGNHTISDCTVSEPREKSLLIESGDTSVTDSSLGGPVHVDNGSPTLTSTSVNGLVTLWGSGNPSLLGCNPLSGGVLSATTGEPQVRDCTVNAGMGLVFNDGAPHIVNNRIENSTIAISIGDVQPAELSGNTGSNNWVNGIGVEGTYHESYTWNASNKGLDYEGALPFVITDEGLTIEEGATLTLESDVVIKAAIGSQGVFLNVRGDLEYDTSETRQVFTSIHDDHHWGNTDNGDAQPQAGDLGCLTIDTEAQLDLLDVDLFYAGHGSEPGIKLLKGTHTVSYCNVLNGGILVDSAGQSTIDHTGISGAEYGIKAIVGSSTINHNQMASCSDGILLDKQVGTLNASVTSNLVEQCSYGIRVTDCDASTIATNTVNNCSSYLGFIAGGLENLDIYDNDGTGSRRNGIDLTDDFNWELIKEITLKKNYVPYTLLNQDLVIDDDQKVTLQPGVVVKARDHGIEVQGELIAEGTADERIEFTSAYDDSVAGQTIKDDVPHSPSFRDWKGMTITGDKPVSVRGCRISFGGGDDSAALTIDDCSPAIGRLTIEGGIAISEVSHEKGGTGLWLKGNTTTNLVEVEAGASTISYCHVAVKYDIDDVTRESKPIINGCNLWDSTYGVWISRPLFGYPVDLQNNDWCHFGVENGPAPAGDGSAIYDFDMVDVMPWTGLGQQHQQDNDNDQARPEVAVVYNVDDRPGAVGACENFADVCCGNGVLVRQRKGNDVRDDGTSLWLPGGEKDMRSYFISPGDPQSEGQDPLSFDNVDMGMFSGHGMLKDIGGVVVPEIVFHSHRISDVLVPADIQWGDQDLEWAVIFNCRLCAKSDQVFVPIGNVDRFRNPSEHPEDYPNDPSFLSEIDNRFRASTINLGLHQLLAFASKCYAHENVGSDFSNGLMNGMPIQNAWFQANDNWNAVDRRIEDDIWDAGSLRDPNNVAVSYGASDCMTDCFWGRGSGPGMDPGLGDVTLIPFELCDHGPSFDELEYPNPSMDTIEVIEPPDSTTFEQGNTYTLSCASGFIHEPPSFPMKCEIKRMWDGQNHPAEPFPFEYLNQNQVSIWIPEDLEPGCYSLRFTCEKTMDFGYLEGGMNVVEAQP